MKALLAVWALMLFGAPSQTATRPTVNRAESTDSWLPSFAGKSTYTLGKDPRFKLLLQRELSQHDRSELPWGATSALPEEIMYLLENYPGKPVAVTDGRFVTAPMDFQGAGNFHGLLWCDVTPNQPAKTIFAFVSESLAKDDSADDFDIYIGKGMADSVLPPPFLSDVRSWVKEFNITSVKRSILYDAQNRSETLPAASIISARAQ
jgi:hypothetical protein